MKMENMNIEKLITSGAHYGHPVNKWNPKFKPFIAAKKNGIYIIDLELTLQYLDKALKELLLDEEESELSETNNESNFDPNLVEEENKDSFVEQEVDTNEDRTR